jgi:hypothetical protein
MKFKYINGKDHYWSVRIELNSTEWPEIKNAWEDDEWLDCPIRQWVLDHTPDSCFTCYGLILFRNTSDAEWFRIVWDRQP